MRGLLVAICVLTGCFHDEYDVDDYWTELANAHCTAMEFCCTRAEYNDWWTESDGDRYSCVEAHNAPSYADTIRRDIASGKIHFNAKSAHACVTALEDMPCSDFQPAIRYRETYCTPPLEGQIPLDAGPCTVDEECAAGYCDDQGTCRAFVPAGGSCTADPSACEKPYECQPDGTCGLGRASGASCSSDSQCAGDWCKDDGIFSGGTCYQACQSGG